MPATAMAEPAALAMIASSQKRRRIAAGQVIRSFFGLVVAFAVIWLTTHFAPASFGLPSGAAEAASCPSLSLGFLLLAGSLCAELIEPLKLPHLTGYLAAGLLAGPYVLALVDGPSVVALQKMNGLAPWR